MVDNSPTLVSAIAPRRSSKRRRDFRLVDAVDPHVHALLNSAM